ncbi:iron-siderophore ABC transporter substrate-binding protein [bacterium]|nr:iron-siderophore ABC transporter substrate-binding protein [bacterium]
MNISLHRLTRFMLLGLLTMGLLLACTPTSHMPIVNQRFKTNNCRVVQHAMGETCIPLHPQRVLTIPPDAFANVSALGINPIAAAYDTTELFPAYLQDKIDEVELIGDSTQPNLEKILQLKPDLIIGHAWTPDNYQQLSYIAPTVIPSRDISWKQELVELAKFLNKEELANQLMGKYWRRVEELQQAISDRRHHLQISVAGVSPGFIYAYRDKSPISAVLDDIGLQRPSSQKGDSYYLDNISEERLSDIDGDVLFIVARDGDKGIKEVSEKLSQNPLWQQLEAVQRNQVHIVDYHWHLGDFLAVNAILDDLFKYLVNTP